RPYSPSVPFPEDLYHRLAGSTRFHFFNSSWLENLARQEDFIIDAISRSPEKICILAKVTGYNLNDYAGEKLSYVKPLIIIPSADIIKSKFDDITQSKLRDWEDRFLIDRRT
ncbi:MAG: hypothetical protein NT001_05795, partial [Candidatus Woesearchaeota archaeon]|nr:hypothetical protein [Candidatus Woesearchaeota archaeon]